MARKIKEGQLRIYRNIVEHLYAAMSDLDSQLTWAPLTDSEREDVTKLANTVELARQDACEVLSSLGRGKPQ